MDLEDICEDLTPPGREHVVGEDIRSDDSGDEYVPEEDDGSDLDDFIVEDHSSEPEPESD